MVKAMNKYYEDEVSKVALEIGACFKNKSILILGATGTIGSFLVDTLMMRNIKYNDNIMIYAGSKDEESFDLRFGHYGNNKLIVPFIKDIACPIKIDASVDYIIHAASDSFPKAFKETPVEVMKSNFIGTCNVLDYCKNHKTRMLYISSGEVYGCYEGNTPIKEDYQGYVNNMMSRACYPVGKRASETLCISYRDEYNVDVLIARLSHVYGPYYRKEDNKVHIKFLESAMRHENILFMSGVKQVRSYTYIADVALGILTILFKGNSGEVYNVSNENSFISLEEMAKTIANVGKVNLEYIPNETMKDSANNPMEYAVLDNTKLKELGFCGHYSFNEGIEEIFKIRND